MSRSTPEIDTLKTLHTALIDSRNGYEEALTQAEGGDHIILFQELIAAHQTSTVEIEQYREEGRLLRVSAVIWVEREGQKGIVVGAGGQQMRAIGQSARMAIERLLDRKVHLELWCKVRENWSDDEAQLRRFGYVD